MSNWWAQNIAAYDFDRFRRDRRRKRPRTNSVDSIQATRPFEAKNGTKEAAEALFKKKEDTK